MAHTLELSDEQYRLLQSLAQQQGMTPTETLDHLLHEADTPENTLLSQTTEDVLEQSPLFQIAGLFDADLPPGWADHHDEIIAEEAMNQHAEQE